MQRLTFKSRDKGQAAIEFIFVLGAMVLIIFYAFPFVSRHAELNKGIAAVRDGAQFGASMRGMGFTSSEIKNSPGVIKIDRIEYYITENQNELDNVTITIYVRGPPELKTTSVIGTIRSEAQRFTAKAISGEYTNFKSDRTGEYYRFYPIQCSYSTWVET